MAKRKNKDTLSNIIDRFIRTELMSIAQGMQYDNRIDLSIDGSDIINNKHYNVGEASYLYNKNDFHNAYINSGYIKGIDGDYGLVSKAVGNRKLPIYQKNIDDIDRSKLTVLGNPKNDYMHSDKKLVDAGDYPTALYVDDVGNIYQKSWDLHDYGDDEIGASGERNYTKFRKKVANYLDKIGNPHVVTSGFVKLNPGEIIQFLDNDDEDIQIKQKILNYQQHKDALNEYVKKSKDTWGESFEYIHKSLNDLYNTNKNKFGGMKKQKRIVPNVIRGGVAIPIGANYFLMKGKTHEQGGIDIGKDLEVENGELIKLDKNNMTIISNAPIMNGISPAEYVLGGLKDGTFTDRFKEGFKYQEKYKDVNGLKDDGTKAKIGKEKTIDEMNSKMLYVPKKESEVIINPPFLEGQVYKEIKDYIGGSPTQARQKAFNKMPRIKEKIIELANTYGIDKNLLAHRLTKEGWIDKRIQEYNKTGSLKQRDFWDKAILREVNAFEDLGLDDAATNLAKGNYNMRNELPFWTIDADNEKGRKVYSIVANSLFDALEFQAADMEYRKNELLKRGYPEENINTYINAAYNLGLYHKDLDDAEWINKTYTVPNYYELGGKLNTRNKYLIGGETIDKSKLTLEEFLQAKADSTRNAAFEKSKNRKTGVKIPYKASKEYLEGLLLAIADRREIADTNFIGPSIETKELVKNGSGNINYYRRIYYNALQEYNDKCDYGYNCIGTATDNYPEDSRTDTNEDFYKNYNKYGFVRIPFTEVKQGDIVQDNNHALIYSGQDEYGSPLFNYSRGGVTEFDYVKDGHYPSKNYIVSRYIGTPELIQQWTKEYNQKRLGGKANMKQNKRNVPPTGKKIKASLGIELNKVKNRIDTPENNRVIKITPEPKLKMPEPLKPTSEQKRNLAIAKTKDFIKNNIDGIGDFTNALVGIGSSIASNRINNKMLNNLEELPEITPFVPLGNTKLKTSYNIHPQLAKARKIANRLNRYVDRNTSSSQTAINRRRQNELDYLENVNSLYGQKENVETQLINQDMMLQHQTDQYNNQLVNQDIARQDARKAENIQLRNTIAEKKAENSVALADNISSIINNMIMNRKQGRANDKTLKVMAAGFPSITKDYLKELGLI